MPSPENERVSPPDAGRLRTAHVVFVDIVGYSLLTTDEQSRTIHQLQAIVRELQGFAEGLAAAELIYIPTGDGMAIVCFGEPTAPVRFARDLAIRIRQESPFSLRIGLHNGPVYCLSDINANMNVAGDGINVAQRIMDCGDGGHILLSQSVADTLLRLSQWKDAVQDFGECEVKHGLRLRIFNLSAPEFGNPGLPRKIQHARSFEKVNADSAQRTPSIAVLPFANMSTDKDNEYFSDGLTEEILNLLAKIPGLKVIARTSAFAFRGKEQDVRRIAEALGVTNVLEGSVRRAGNRIRVTAQLIGATDGSHLWSERYDRDMTDVFALQDEIGQAISAALKVRLAPRTQVVNIEAWQSYLKGVYFRYRYTPDSLAKAKECFEQALAIDPNFALAYSGLAGYYYSQAVLGIMPAVDVAPSSKSYAAKALAIDPGNCEAHGVLGCIAGIFDLDWKSADVHFRKCMLDEPVPPLIRFRYAAFYLLPLRRFREAIGQNRLAMETDPLSVVLQMGMAFSLHCAGQHREAVECARRAMEIDANYFMLWFVMGLAQIRSGSAQDAIASFRRVVELAPWYSDGAWLLAAAYQVADDRARSREWVRKRGGTRPACDTAWYYAAAGEVAALLEALNEELPAEPS